VGPAWGSVRACFKELNMWNYFDKQFTKTTLAPLIELFMELKPKK
jgi:hypothetical protein